MMRSLLTLLLLSTAVNSTSAQGVWTWLHGDTANQPVSNASRGTMGLPSPSNLPAPARDIRWQVSWTDKNDNFWLIQKDSVGTSDATLTVWRYAIAKNEWTWMAGYDSFMITGSYSSTIKQDYLLSLKRRINMDYAIDHYVQWVDTAGNCWIMTQSPVTKDMFLSKFNIKNLDFEIIDHRPNNYAFKGAQGQALAANFPDLSYTTYWVIGSNAYIYGGIDRDKINRSQELWKYNMTTKLWTWLKGEKPAIKAIYGVKGQAADANQPDSKWGSIRNWTRGKKLYLFGGIYDLSYTNDLWQYDIATNQWTWIHGDSITIRSNPGDTSSQSYGLYPSGPCVDQPNIYPRGRIFVGGTIQSSICDKVFWVYGGYTVYGASSELWMYKPDENKWLWVSGEPVVMNSSYNYGKREVKALSNFPSTSSGYILFADSKGSIYTYAGVSNISSKFSNELWRYDPDYSCINYNITDKFIERGSRTYICVGDSTVVRVRKGYDSLRVSPMTAVTLRQTDTTTEVWLKPSANASYQIIAYGYRCESFLDSMTVPITLAPLRIGAESKAICQGESYHGKTTSGSYKIIFPYPLGCDSTLNLTLTVKPHAARTIDSTVCEGVSVLGRSVSGTYRDTFPAANGCDSVRTLRLTVIPKFLTIDTAICQGENLFGYNRDGSFLDTLTSPQGCITYRTLKLRVNNPSSSSHTRTICQGQTYWGHSTAGLHRDTLRNTKGCDSIRILNLIVHQNSFHTLNKKLCQGESFEGRSQSGTYLDTFQNAMGCDSIRTLVLVIGSTNFIKKLRDTAICRGSEAILDAGLGHRDYRWSTGAQTPSILVKNEGEYKLSFTDTANCKGRDSAKVKYHNDTEIILQDEISNYKGELLFLNPHIKPSDVGGKYRWSPSHIFQCDSCRSARFKLDNSAVVRLEFTDAQGCKAYKDVKVNIYDSYAVGFPTAFSPNGDALNDTYFPNVANILSYTYAVYNRWGEKVFQATHQQSGWDGSYKGQAAPMGMYSYYAEVVLLNGVKQTYSGSFQVVR